MTVHHEPSPAIPIHPGEIVQEELEERGWTQKGFAEKIGRPMQLINNIIDGRSGISAETALDFAEAFGTSAQFWLNLDSNYRLAIARKKRAERKVS